MFYKALHGKINSTYSHIELAEDNDAFDNVHKAFGKAIKYLHEKGSFSSDDLTHEDVQPLIKETYKVLKDAVNTTIQTEVSAAMLNKLQNDVFVFSGMKTYTQLKEVSLLLVDVNNQIKSFAKFEQDVLKINNTYNRNYLQAEYQHAISASQSAAQYNDFIEDAGRYNLQIRTAGDDKVRESHNLLNGITLPDDDPFWNTTWTPFDWRCRCRIIQVLKSKFPVTDSGIAQAAAQQAIPEMFRYNPGKQAVIFPPNHPYYGTSKPAMDVVKGMADDNAKKESAIVDVSKHIKTNATSTAVKNILKEYAEKQPENFNYGLETIKFSESRSYLMQHELNFKDGGLKSTIRISKQTFGGHNPARDLMEGFEAIKNGKQLTRNQEESFNSMWHEILHAKTKSERSGLTDKQREHMETVNEFIARHTYPKFIEAFGGKASHQKELLENGLGYENWIKEFRKKLADKGIDEQKAVEFLEPHLMSDYKSLGSKIKELLGE